MEENKKKKKAAAEKAEEPKTEKAEQTEQAEAPAAEPSAAEKALATALAELDAKEKELAEAKDKYLRMLAEYDNYRKRTQKEREGAYADGLCDGVKEMLPIIDNLERAAAVADPSKIAEGLALTLKQANAALAAMKVEETAAVGGSFDPTMHNAVMHEEDDSRAEGEITEVFMRGYRRGDKIIRDAMVKVAN